MILSFEPIIDKNCKILVLGTMPSVKSLEKQQYKPFGYGPWPCLNKASDHYLQSVVTDMKVTYGADVKKPIGTFKCSCGFVYARSGPDVTEHARYTVGRIKAFGPVWESRLKELAEEKLTLRETARLLGVDPNTVKKYAKKLGLATYWEKRSNDDNESVVIILKGLLVMIIIK